MAVAEAVLVPEAAFGRFLDDDDDEEAADAAAEGDGATGAADEDAAAVVFEMAPGVGAGEASNETLERPLRIETSSKAA